MLDEIYVQTTPMPHDLHPPVEMEVIAYASEWKKDPFTEFMDAEKAAFNAWTDHLPLGGFNIVQGFQTMFVCFTTELPKKGSGMPVERVFASLMDDICTGAVMGDVGCSIADVSMGSRARWVVTEQGLNEKPSQAARLSPLIFVFLVVACFLATTIATIMLR